MDPSERAELLATGVRRLIEEGKFAEAGQRLADIRDEKVRDQLGEYLYFRAAESSLKKLGWYGFNAQVDRVSDARLRTYLLLGRERDQPRRPLRRRCIRRDNRSAEVQALAPAPRLRFDNIRAAQSITLHTAFRHSQGEPIIILSPSVFAA